MICPNCHGQGYNLNQHWLYTSVEPCNPCAGTGRIQGFKVTEDQIQANVNDALRKARVNGYFLASSYDAGELEQIAIGLLNHDSAVAGLGVGQVFPYVKGFFRRTGQYRGD